MAEETEQAEDGAEAAEAGGGMMKKIVLIVGALALLGGGVFAGMTFMGGDEPVDGEELAENTEPDAAPPIYQSLHPPLIVNFKDSVGDAHYMQITMEAMARDQDVINSVRDHTPVIRNALILLFSSAIYEEVVTLEGKKKLLSDGLTEIQTVMTEQIGEPGVEALYFTALVIQ